jgi:predicted nucleic-acid-binding protein
VKRIFLDTSPLLAYLTDSDKAQADQVELWLLQAGQGKLILFTTTLVVVESVDVLELGFAIDRRRIKEIMLGVLHSDGLEVQVRDVLVQALYSFAEGEDSFSVCYHRALVKSGVVVQG